MVKVKLFPDFYTLAIFFVSEGGGGHKKPLDTRSSLYNSKDIQKAKP